MTLVLLLVGRRFWGKIAAQHRGCCIRSKMMHKEENDTQVGIIIFYVFLVIFCSFGPHYVDCGHCFVVSVKK